MKTESDFKFNYLITELESLGIRTEKLNELNDLYEIQNLVNNIEQTFFQDYKSFCDYGVKPGERKIEGNQVNLTHLSETLVLSN